MVTHKHLNKIYIIYTSHYLIKVCFTPPPLICIDSMRFIETQYFKEKPRTQRHYQDEASIKKNLTFKWIRVLLFFVRYNGGVI